MMDLNLKHLKQIAQDKYVNGYSRNKFDATFNQVTVLDLIERVEGHDCCNSSVYIIKANRLKESNDKLQTANALLREALPHLKNGQLVLHNRIQAHLGEG